MSGKPLHMEIPTEKVFEVMIRTYPKKSWVLDFSPHHEPSDDLYNSTKRILKLGQLVGIVPLQGLWRKGSSAMDLTYRRFSAFGTVNVTVATLMLINFMMNIAGMFRKVLNGQSNPVQIAWAMAPVMLYSNATYVYDPNIVCHFMMHAERLISLYASWHSTTRSMVYSRVVDKAITKRLTLGASVAIALCIVESILYQVTRFSEASVELEYYHNGTEHLKPDPGRSHLEEYYIQEHQDCWAGFPYHPMLAILLLVVNKLSMLAISYSDITTMSMTWVMSTKLKELNGQVAAGIADGSINLARLRSEVMGLHKLVQEINAFLSPLIFCSYAMLIMVVSTQIHLGITTGHGRSTIPKIYSLWSLFHLSLRLIVMSVFCSRIPERFHELLLILQDCPSEIFEKELAWTERLLATPTALTGLGCFRVTKPFILSVIHVIFTCEIIFLQTRQSFHPMINITSINVS